MTLNRETRRRLTRFGDKPAVRHARMIRRARMPKDYHTTARAIRAAGHCAAPNDYPCKHKSEPTCISTCAYLEPDPKDVTP